MAQFAFSAPSPDFLLYFTAGIERLTNREREVCQILIEGYSSKEAAQKLHISPRTVEIHRSRIFEKTGTRNLLEVVRMIAALPQQIDLDRVEEAARKERRAKGYRAFMADKFLSHD